MSLMNIAVGGEVQDLKARAFERFRELGLPTPRSESWKYTRTKTFAHLIERTVTGVELFGSDLPAHTPLLDDAIRLVLINGQVDPFHSDLDDLPAGVSIRALSNVFTVGDAPAAAALGTVLGNAPLALAALNTARFVDGFAIEVAPGTVVERPIQLISVARGRAEGLAAHPRLLMTVGEDAGVTLLETHLGQEGAPVFINWTGEIAVARAARVRHYRLQRELSGTAHVAATAVTLADRAVYENFALQIGDGLVRNEIRTLIDGSHAECQLNGAYAIGGTGHMDTTTFIDHARPDSRSRETYKGVLSGTARGVFQGKILVRRAAQRTDGHQLNRTLLLDRGAEMDSKPELEIYADDVRCSHGATCGNLDPAQLFYLKSRAIPHKQAHDMLVRAFLTEALDTISDAPVRTLFTDALDRKMAAQVHPA